MDGGGIAERERERKIFDVMRVRLRRVSYLVRNEVFHKGREVFR